MIDEITIRDLGVIAEAVLPLGPGFTAVTGETGAGKTMVVQALGLLMGQRAVAGQVRLGSAQSWVEGRWSVRVDGVVAQRVRDAGGEVEEFEPRAALGELILSRSVSGEGRSRAIVGGRSAPVGVLGELGESLVVVHGQSDQLRLKSSTEQRLALDRFAGRAFRDLLDSYESAFHAWQGLRSELETLVSQREARIREADALRIAVAEIDALAPIAGEEEALAERASRLTNLEDLRLAAASARESVSSDELDGRADTVGLLDSALRQLERVQAHDPALEPIVESLTSASFLVAEISTQLSSYLAELDTDGGSELDEVQDRRAALSVLARKYGPTLDEVIDYFGAAGPRLIELENDSDRIDELTDATADALALAETLAANVSVARSEAAGRLSGSVSDELAALAMGGSSLVVEVVSGIELTTSGRDAVHFLLASHAGAEPRPLGRGASGGELSRIMLAIEVVLAATDPVPTFVFDEVDAGVGGASAIEIGRRLARLAEQSQVIVVTHLAQVAAFATNHLSVVKDSEGAVTESSVQQLTGEARVAEMARLLSGLPDSESGLAHARELIELASESGA
ncbi:DNA repair protein RecN [Subtercola boreus]|uniref:DNA repair protein RecN n=1 Tax=Subtercola boreus TaxID=120213 RepID=A0A3E0WB82_9MICO|nr:DNA repair protein RecN [Subtercola boreus]RFA20996.1 DNA repair protein RecN [Subtercola boreus]RFA21380.1 DNA repair protein RecN [Subtercola boreus]RFA27689.1 DNA repair protein RecN [Subtercola boreus]